MTMVTTWAMLSLSASRPGRLGTAKLFYGTSKTALINSVAATGTPPNYLAKIDPSVIGTKYFMQLRIDAGQAGEGAKSGIYYAVST